MGYLRPCGDVYISDTWQGHRDRTPPSSEPGVDYASAYGSALIAADAGIVADLKTSNSGATGRYLTLDLDDGRRVRYLHLDSILIGLGWRVQRGWLVAFTGASANGSDWGVGSHVHTTLFPQHSYDFSNTLDFERYVQAEPPPPDPPPVAEDDDMPRNTLFTYVRASDDRTVRAVVNTGSGFIAEWTDDSIKTADIAESFDTGPAVPITQGYRDSILTSLNDVQHLEVEPTPSGSTSSHPLSTPAWIGGFFLGLIGLVELIRFIVDVIV